MTKEVSAKTITAITGAAGFHTTGIPPAPTRDALIAAFRAELDIQVLKTQSGKRGVAPAPALKEKFNAVATDITLARALEHRAAFEEILKNIPDGYCLAPVFFSRITADEADKIEKEFSKSRPRFLKFLANTQEDALAALGIDAQGIQNMKKGKDPVNAQGRSYRLSVDHIIERAGSGLWGMQRTADDADGGAMKYNVNHFSNFVFMPDKVHEYKNLLNGLQHFSALSPGEGKWGLMIVPKDFMNVSTPQQVFRGRPRKSALEKKMTTLAFFAQQAEDGLAQFRRNPVVAQTLKTFEDIAQTCGEKLADFSNDNEFSNLVTKDARVVFNDLAKAQVTGENTNLSDTFNTLNKALAQSFRATRTALPNIRARETKKLRHVRNSEVFKALYQKTEGVVFEGAMAFRAQVAEVDAYIEQQRQEEKNPRKPKEKTDKKPKNKSAKGKAGKAWDKQKHKQAAKNSMGSGKKKRPRHGKKQDEKKHGR